MSLRGETAGLLPASMRKGWNQLAAERRELLELLSRSPERTNLADEVVERLAATEPGRKVPPKGKEPAK